MGSEKPDDKENPPASTPSQVRDGMGFSSYADRSSSPFATLHGGMQGFHPPRPIIYGPAEMHHDSTGYEGEIQHSSNDYSTINQGGFQSPISSTGSSAFLDDNDAVVPDISLASSQAELTVDQHHSSTNSGTSSGFVGNTSLRDTQMDLPQNFQAERSSTNSAENMSPESIHSQVGIATGGLDEQNHSTEVPIYRNTVRNMSPESSMHFHNHSGQQSVSPMHLTGQSLFPQRTGSRFAESSDIQPVIRNQFPTRFGIQHNEHQQTGTRHGSVPDWIGSFHGNVPMMIGLPFVTVPVWTGPRPSNVPAQAGPRIRFGTTLVMTGPRPSNVPVQTGPRIRFGTSPVMTGPRPSNVPLQTGPRFRFGTTPAMTGPRPGNVFQMGRGVRTADDSMKRRVRFRPQMPRASAPESPLHVRWQGLLQPPPELSGHKCMICKRDVIFNPDSPVSRLPYGNPLVVAVLPCGHVFHDHCLQNITPQDQSKHPPCIPCALGDSET